MFVCLQSHSLAPPTDAQHCPSEQEEVREEKLEEQREKSSTPSAAPPMNLLATVFRLRKDLHRAEEQRARVGSRVRQHLLQGVRQH